MPQNPPKGVYITKKKDGSPYYRASITYKGRHISLGSGPDLGLAAKAYDTASRLITDSSTGLEDYAEEYGLPFEKWVVLINFRDNGLYIPTPIYLRKKYFDYYLTRDRVLKFDLDDLFYYSAHKIMARGDRLFVSDYGLQTAITARYGIKPYAVVGRDYRFVNGDPSDFRYENIEVTNIYQGVTSHRDKKAPFRASIHIRGDVLIGYYPTDIEAAIAYNKAIDALAERGCKKAYMRNYIQALSAKEYEEIYQGISLSPSLATIKLP